MAKRSVKLKPGNESGNDFGVGGGESVAGSEATGIGRDSSSLELAREHVAAAVLLLNALGPRYSTLSWLLEDTLNYFDDPALDEAGNGDSVISTVNSSSLVEDGSSLLQRLDQLVSGEAK